MNLSDSLTNHQDPQRIITALRAVHDLTIVQRNVSIERFPAIMETNRARYQVSSSDVESLEKGEFDALLLRLAEHQRHDVWVELKRILLIEPRLIGLIVKLGQEVTGWAKQDPTTLSTNQLYDYLECYHRDCVDKNNRFLAGAIAAVGPSQYGSTSTSH